MNLLLLHFLSVLSIFAHCNYEGFDFNSISLDVFGNVSLDNFDVASMEDLRAFLRSKGQTCDQCTAITDYRLAAYSVLVGEAAAGGGPVDGSQPQSHFQANDFIVPPTQQKKEEEGKKAETFKEQFKESDTIKKDRGQHSQKETSSKDPSAVDYKKVALDYAEWAKEQSIVYGKIGLHYGRIGAQMAREYGGYAWDWAKVAGRVSMEKGQEAIQHARTSYQAFMEERARRQAKEKNEL